MVEYHAIKEIGWIFNSERTPDKSDYYIAWIFDPSVDRFEVRKIWFKVNEQDGKNQNGKVCIRRSMLSNGFQYQRLLYHQSHV